MKLSEPTLFIVDDALESYDSIAALAEASGLRCEQFLSAEQFLERFVPSQPGCALVDFRLGGMNGLELQKRLARLDDALPVIIISAYADVRTAVQAVRNGAFTVIEKPCGFDELSETIRAALEYNRAARSSRDRQTTLAARFHNLTDREREVITLVLEGLPNKAIACRLDVSQRTLNRIRADVLRKMEAQSVVELAQLLAELQSQGPKSLATIEHGAPCYRIDREEFETAPNAASRWGQHRDFVHTS